MLIRAYEKYSKLPNQSGSCGDPHIFYVKDGGLKQQWKAADSVE